MKVGRLQPARRWWWKARDGHGPKLRMTKMNTKSRNADVSPAQGPNVDLDSELRSLWVEAVDASPKGRRGMGMHQYRVNKAAQGTYTPRPSDLMHAVEAGADAGRLALGLMALADRLMAAVPEEDGCFPTAAREVGEALAAGAEWITAPSPATASKLANEAGEAMTALSLLTRLAKREQAQHEAARRDARRRLQLPAGRVTPICRMEVVK